MAKESIEYRGQGVSALSLLGVAFVILKLTGVIDWAWIWVLAPFWIPWAIILGILLVVGLVVLAVKLYDHRQRKKYRKARDAGRARAVANK